MALLDRIAQIAQEACPDYTLVYDTDRMANVEADDIRFPALLVPEFYDRGLTYRFGWRDTARLELSFMRLVPMHGDAVERERVREQIRREAVRPFLKALEASGLFESIESTGTVISSPNEPPRFDANAVSVFLRMDVVFKEDCL